MIDKITRERLIKCLIKHHGYNTKELEKIGFNRDELLIIEDQMKANRFIGRIKDFLRFLKENEK